MKKLTESKTTQRVAGAAAVSTPLGIVLASLLFDLLGYNASPEVETAVATLITAVFTALGSRWLAARSGK